MNKDVICGAGGIPLLVALLKREEATVLEHAAWAIGNIEADNSGAATV